MSRHAERPRIDGYAEALFEVARAEGTLDEVEDELFRFARALEGNDELRDALTDPHIPASAASRSSRTCSAARPPHDHGRPGLAGRRRRPGPRPAGDHRPARRARRAERRQGGRRGALRRRRSPRTSGPAWPKRSSKATGKDVEVKVIVDPTVIGGVVTQVGDTVIDGSCAHRLDQLREALLDAEEEPTMAELTINTTDITAALRKNLEGFEPERRDAAGRPHPRGRRRHRPRLRPARRGGERAARVRGRHARPGAEPRRGVDRRGRPRRRARRTSRRARPVRATGRILSVPVGDGAARPGGERRWASPSTARARSSDAEPPPHGDPGARHHRPPAGARAAADRHQGRSTR